MQGINQPASCTVSINLAQFKCKKHLKLFKFPAILCKILKIMEFNGNLKERMIKAAKLTLILTKIPEGKFEGKNTNSVYFHRLALGHPVELMKTKENVT